MTVTATETAEPVPTASDAWARSHRRPRPTSTAGSATTSTAMTAVRAGRRPVYLTSDELNDGILWWWALIAADRPVLLGLAVLGSRVVARRLVRAAGLDRRDCPAAGGR